MQNFIPNNRLVRVKVGDSAAVSSGTNGPTVDTDQAKVVIHNYSLQGASAAAYTGVGKIQHSDDDITYVDIAGATNVISSTDTTSTSLGINLKEYAIEVINPTKRYHQLCITMSAGSPKLVKHTAILQDVRTSPQPTDANFVGTTKQAV